MQDSRDDYRSPATEADFSRQPAKPAPVIGRFAPSPTGDLHLGNLRTALVAWLFARSAGSGFAMRVEDHDQLGSKPEVERQQLADLATLGLDWDGEVLRTSDRAAIYAAAIDDLTERGLTYPCFCSRKDIREAAQAPNAPIGLTGYPGTCRDLTVEQRAERAVDRPGAIRLRTDLDTQVGFHDRLCGEFRGPVDDFVIRRNDGVAAYNLTVVIDDAVQGVEQVVRGDDLLDSTPRQIYVGQLLGLPTSAYAHLPLALNHNGDRLAKRDGAVTLSDRTALGESPDHVRAVLATSLGLTEPGEPAPMATLLERFDPDRLPREPWTYQPTS